MRKATNKSENNKDAKTVEENENKTVQKTKTKKSTVKVKNSVENNNEDEKKNKTKTTNKKIEENRLPNIEKVSEKKSKAKNKSVDNNTNANKPKMERKKKVKSSDLENIIEEKEETNLENNIVQENEEKSLLKEENIEINHEKLEKIKDEIKKSKKDSKDKIKNSSLRKNLVRNLSIAIIITIYFLFIDLGINSIPVTVYMLDLKTFAIFIAIISIVIFEKAFKKDENYLAIHGIEMILVGVETLLLLQLYSAGNEYFNYILLAITLGMIVYYLIKCLIIFIRYKVKGK